MEAETYCFHALRHAGSVLRQAELRLEDFWAANFAQPAGQDSGEEDGGPWARAVDGVVEIMHDMLVSLGGSLSALSFRSHLLAEVLWLLPGPGSNQPFLVGLPCFAGSSDCQLGTCS